MTQDAIDFTAALRAYLDARLREVGDAEYCTEALQVVDARGHLFRPAGRRATDEAADIYALRDLCRMDEERLCLVPNDGRLAAVARNYF